MKVVTSKELQLHRAAILKDVQTGQEYQITFHRRPIAKLVPINKPKHPELLKGSRAAFLESLKYTSPGKGDIMSLSHKQLRKQMYEDKHHG